MDASDPTSEHRTFIYLGRYHSGSLFNLGLPELSFSIFELPPWMNSCRRYRGMGKVDIENLLMLNMDAWDRTGGRGLITAARELASVGNGLLIIIQKQIV